MSSILSRVRLRTIGRTQATSGDQAILDALKAKQATSDPKVRQDATTLLNTLAEHYKTE